MKTWFKCADCNYSSHEFNATISDISRGRYLYQAICPHCGSSRVNIIPEAPGMKHTATKIKIFLKGD